MKHLLAALLCLLLCGCTPQTSPEAELPPETVPAKTGMYDPHHPVELAYPGEVRAYPLTQKQVHGILPFGRKVLTLSGSGNTAITLLSGEELWEEAVMTVDFELRQEDPSLRIHEGHISFFDPTARETLVLDGNLREVQRIAAPDNLSGVPLLSDDRSILYYCTPWSVMAWNLESGIRRTLRELSCEGQTVSALHRGSTVLQCSVREENTENLLFLSAEDGRALHTLPADGSVFSGDSRYFAAVPAGNMELLIYGEEESSAKMLLPEQFPDCQYYLPEDHAVVTAADTGDGFTLDYYELNTGILRASFTPEPFLTLKNVINCQGHALYILAGNPETGSDILYRWDALRKPPESGNTASHSFPYSPADNPDSASLAACQEYAETIGRKYGITVLVGEKAAEVQPWDYRFTPEHLAPVLRRELDMLDRCLSCYPETVLQQTAAHFSGLTVCLVREITGTPESGSLDTATGIQFFQDGEAYVVIAAGKYARQALYHEFYHVMETHILTESTALDTWESLNPAGFSYTGSHSSHPEAEVYLRGQTRAFVDRYSMCYAKEDRARIFEYATLPGNEDLFPSEYMQRKLNAVCSAIREAYRLNRVPEVLPWEQYLATPLAAAE